MAAVFSVQFREIRGVSDRDDEQVAGIDRLDVEEGGGAVVAIDEAGFALAGNDGAEEAGLQVVTPGLRLLRRCAPRNDKLLPDVGADGDPISTDDVGDAAQFLVLPPGLAPDERLAIEDGGAVLHPEGLFAGIHVKDASQAAHIPGHRRRHGLGIDGAFGDGLRLRGRAKSKIPAAVDGERFTRSRVGDQRPGSLDVLDRAHPGKELRAAHRAVLDRLEFLPDLERRREVDTDDDVGLNKFVIVFLGGIGGDGHNPVATLPVRLPVHGRLP